jgi:hypothetical protein
MNNKFLDDLEFGNMWEREWIKILEKSGYTDIYQVPNDITFYDYDVKAKKNNKEITFEIKADRRAYSGKICIEYMNKGEFSGINKTKADFWIHYALDGMGGYTIFKFPRKDLKNMLRNKEFDCNLTTPNGCDIVLFEMAKIDKKYVYKVVYGDFLEY